MQEDLLLMCVVAVVFALASLLGSCAWYAKRQSVSYKTALLVLWQEGIVAGVNTGIRPALPTAKAAWSYTKRLAMAFWEYLKPTPPKHVFDPGLYQEVFAIVKDYAYAGFQPVIKAVYAPLPSYLHISFYTKSAITEELAAEITWHIESKFREYQEIYGLRFDSTAIPFVVNNYYEVRVYYAEHPAEYAFYRAICRQAMLLRADPEFRPLLESDVPPSTDLVLGYRYEPWRDSGQIVPILWDMAMAAHLAIGGYTGGGKTTMLKKLLEALLVSGASVTICDYKGYGDLRGFVKDYAVGKDCDAVLAAFCTEFERVRAQGYSPCKRILIFEEFTSFSASKEKKEFDALMRMISNLIFMGRAYDFHVILVGQRFDADVLKTSLRDQFGMRVYMGTSISAQAAAMFFPNSEIDKSERLPPYCGYISTPRIDCDVLIMPKVDVAALDRRLKALGNANG